MTASLQKLEKYAKKFNLPLEVKGKREIVVTWPTRMVLRLVPLPTDGVAVFRYLCSCFRVGVDYKKPGYLLPIVIIPVG